MLMIAKLRKHYETYTHIFDASRCDQCSKKPQYLHGIRQFLIAKKRVL